MGGGGAGGRGEPARTNPASRAATPDPAAHREARPAGWAAEPESGTGEARAERAAGAGAGPRGCGVWEPGMRRGERARPAAPARPAGRRGPGERRAGAVGIVRPARGRPGRRLGGEKGARWLGSLLERGPALGIRIRNSGVRGKGGMLLARALGRGWL